MGNPSLGKLERGHDSIRQERREWDGKVMQSWGLKKRPGGGGIPA